MTKKEEILRSMERLETEWALDQVLNYIRLLLEAEKAELFHPLEL